MRLVASLVLLAFTSIARGADDPDFYLISSTCNATIASLSDFAAPMKTQPGDLTNMRCFRSGKDVTCDLSWQGNQAEAKRITYRVSVDAPPVLSFTDPESGDYVVINTVQHTGVIISRFVSTVGAGAKVCVGMFATAMETEALLKKK